jgi:microcystin-dependent protein
MAADDKQTGNALRINGHYGIYRNGELVSRTPYSILDYISEDYPAITLDDWQYHTAQHAEARAQALIDSIENKCSNFKVINDIITKDALCGAEEDDFMIGQIIDFAGATDKFDVNKWMPCDGRTLNITDYDELYQIIGTIYGGDGITSFKLPSLNGRVSIGVGHTEGLPSGDLDTTYVLAEKGGENTHKLTSMESNKHSHLMLADAGASGADGNKPTSTGHVGWNRETAGNTSYRASGVSTYPTLGMTGETGGDQRHENRQPYIVVYKLIRYKN